MTQLCGSGNFEDTTNMNKELPFIPDFNRRIFCDSSKTQKYWEIINFVAPKSNNKGMAVVIGANPALLDLYHVDATNGFIAKELWNKGYTGYLLLNMYSIVTKSIVELKEIARNIPNIYQGEKVINFLQKYHSNMDLFLIWGKAECDFKFVDQTSIEKSLEFILKTWKKDIYFNCLSGRFLHPMRKIGNRYAKGLIKYDHAAHWNLIKDS